MKFAPIILCLLAGLAQAATIDLSAESSRAIGNDLVQAVVYAEDTGPAADVAQRVNARMAQAMALAKRYPAIQIQSGSSHTSPVYGKTRRIEAWRMRSDLRLESTDAPAMSELLGKLQQELAVENIAAIPSASARARVEKELLNEAIAAFRAKAEIVAKALGGAYKIKSMVISGAPGPLPRPMMALRAMASEAAPMPIEAGESQVVISVSGQIEVAD